MRNLTLACVAVVVLCASADAQPMIAAYSASVPVTGWTVDAQGEPVIGTVTVPLLIVSSVPNGSVYPCFSGGNNSSPEFSHGTPVKPTAFAMTLMERPISAGAIMTIVDGNARVSLPRGEGWYGATYQTTPPLSGNITVNLVASPLGGSFPSSISLTQTTVSYVP